MKVYPRLTEVRRALASERRLSEEPRFQGQTPVDAAPIRLAADGNARARAGTVKVRQRSFQRLKHLKSSMIF